MIQRSRKPMILRLHVPPRHVDRHSGLMEDSRKIQTLCLPMLDAFFSIEQMRGAENPVHGGPDLVAHRGEKRGFGLGRGLGSGPFGLEGMRQSAQVEQGVDLSRERAQRGLLPGREFPGARAGVVLGEQRDDRAVESRVGLEPLRSRDRVPSMVY